MVDALISILPLLHKSIIASLFALDNLKLVLFAPVRSLDAVTT